MVQYSIPTSGPSAESVFERVHVRASACVCVRAVSLQTQPHAKEGEQHHVPKLEGDALGPSHKHTEGHNEHPQHPVTRCCCCCLWRTIKYHEHETAQCAQDTRMSDVARMQHKQEGQDPE